MHCNATVGMEHMGWGIGGMKKAATKKKVVVVGGGPAGLEAARVAALKGHDVTLYEKDRELGGQALQAEKLPGREEMGGLVRWQKIQLPQAGVKIVTGTEANSADDPEHEAQAGRSYSGNWLYMDAQRLYGHELYGGSQDGNRTMCSRQAK